MKILIKEALNYAIENETTDTITNGKRTLIQKPGKPKGIIKNLKPIILLNTFRKIFLIAIYYRITPKVNKFLSLSQTAYRKRRSPSEIVMCYRLLSSVIQKQKTTFFILGIDMTLGFDLTRKNLEVLIDEDEMDMVKTLIEKQW